jgi:hypothetical protein
MEEIEYMQFNPVSAISRIVCLIAQMMLSMNSLNCVGGTPNNAARQASSMLKYITISRAALTWEAI